MKFENKNNNKKTPNKTTTRFLSDQSEQSTHPQGVVQSSVLLQHTHTINVLTGGNAAHTHTHTQQPRYPAKKWKSLKFKSSVWSEVEREQREKESHLAKRCVEIGRPPRSQMLLRFPWVCARQGLVRWYASYTFVCCCCTLRHSHL